jgi:hypothetical protein
MVRRHQLPPAHGLASAASQYGRGRTRPNESAGRARTAAITHQNPALFLSNRAQLCGLGAPVLRLRRRSPGHAASAYSLGIGSRLSHPSGRATARLGQHAESGAVRDPVPVSGGPRSADGESLRHDESKTRDPSAGCPECARDGRAVGCHARDHLAHGCADRATLLAEVGREELQAQLRSSEALHRADRASGLAGVWMLRDGHSASPSCAPIGQYAASLRNASAILSALGRLASSSTCEKAQ